MDSQDTLLDTFRSVKRQRRATAKVDPDTGPALSRKAGTSGATNAPRRTLFSSVKQDEMVEKCKGVPEWRVRAPVAGVHAHGSGTVYVAFSSLEAALNYAKVLRNPPPPKPRPSKPPRVDSRTNRKRSSSNKRSASHRDEESDDRLLCNTDEVMRVVVEENVEDAFSRALGDMPVEPSVDPGTDEPRLECDEELDGELDDAFSNAGSESTDCQMRVECRQVVVSPLSLPVALVEPCTPPSLLPNAAARCIRSNSVLLEPPTLFSVKTVRHVSRQPRPVENALSTTLFETPTKHPSFPFAFPESKDKRLLTSGDDRAASDATPKRRGRPSARRRGARRRAATERGARASLSSRFAPIALDDVLASAVGATTTGADVSDLF